MRLARVLARGGVDPYRRREQLGEGYAPIRDPYLSGLLGLGVSVYQRSPGHMAHGYADVGERNINLAQPDFEQLSALRNFGNQRVTPRMARAAYEAAHEMGHVHRGNSEDAANAWGAAHLGSVLRRLGLGRSARRQVIALDRRQLLL